jgi:hypothetical protein
MNIPGISAIERPRCKTCSTRMILAEVQLLKDGAEKRTFECPKCSVVVDKIAADPKQLFA